MVGNHDQKAAHVDNTLYAHPNSRGNSGAYQPQGVGHNERVEKQGYPRQRLYGRQHDKHALLPDWWLDGFSNGVKEVF